MSDVVAASVIVPTYNRPGVLEQCLRALLSQDAETPPFEIIVVDDASTDDTGARVVALAADNRVHYMRHQANRGLSATRNTGIRRARGEVVVFLDDDIVVEPDYLRAHLARHAAADRLAVVGNLVYPDALVARSNCARYLQTRGIGYRWASGRELLDFDDLHPRFLGGGIHSIRREVLVGIGLFDEAVRFYGYEDHLYAHRLHQAGIRIVLAPEARATHLDAVTVAWFRAKMLQAGRDGLAMLRLHCPDFLEETALPTLLPVDWSRDRGGRLLRKLAVRGVLNPMTVSMLEYWAMMTDHIGALYSGMIYRALNAGWILQGQKLRRDGRPLVQYGD
jgi:GT2 family glycosyltransferase